MAAAQERIRIVVADDHPLYRDGVASTLDAQPDMTVVGQGSTAAEAEAIAKRELPDIALLDITMPGGGLTAAGAIAETCPVTKIVMLTVSEDEDDVLEAFRLGARAYILKGVSSGELVSILRSVADGDVYVTPALASRVLSEMSGHGGESKTTGILDLVTERERQILELVASGDSNKEIAYGLGISEKTVKHYMTNILQTLHARNRVEAALLAHDAGLGKLSTESDKGE